MLTAYQDADYPFADGLPDASPLRAVVDAAVFAPGGLAELVGFNTTTAYVEVEIDGQPVLAGTATQTSFGVYDVYSISDQDTGHVLRLTVPTGLTIAFVGRQAFTLQVHDYSGGAVWGVNGEPDTPIIELGEGLSFTVSGQLVTIVAADPIDRQAAAPCPGIFTINGVSPDLNGNIAVTADGCYRLTPDLANSRLKIDNLCTPCVDCSDFYDLYRALMSIDDYVAADVDRAVSLISKYHELVDRLGRALNEVTTQQTPLSAGFGKALAGGVNELEALVVLARAVDDSYGIGLGVSVINNLDHDLSVTVRVETAVEVRPTEPVEINRPASVGGPSTGETIPGLVTIGTVPSKASANFTGAFHDLWRVGETIDITLTATASAPELAEDLVAVVGLSAEIGDSYRLGGDINHLPTDGGAA